MKRRRFARLRPSSPLIKVEAITLGAISVARKAIAGLLQATESQSLLRTPRCPRTRARARRPSEGASRPTRRRRRGERPAHAAQRRPSAATIFRFMFFADSAPRRTLPMVPPPPSCRVMCFDPTAIVARPSSITSTLCALARERRAPTQEGASRPTRRRRRGATRVARP